MYNNSNKLQNDFYPLNIQNEIKNQYQLIIIVEHTVKVIIIATF